ncbi:MAG: hypothetical protein WC979_02845 [Candidatus Pacearchaeota archaeon]
MKCYITRFVVSANAIAIILTLFVIACTPKSKGAMEKPGVSKVQNIN